RSRIASRSNLSEGQAFWDLITRFASAETVQMRTFGVPLTVHRQFGQRPAQQKSPRGRWYLKLRETTCCPAACSAPPTVCPASARIVLPSNSNSQGPFESATRGLLWRK